METGTARLGLDGKWELNDLSDLTSVYTQLYALAFSLSPAEDSSRDERIDYVYTKFPWRGGYSAVNFYNNLYYLIPAKYRPKIDSIHYSSPGHIDLVEVMAVAATIAATVRFVASAVNHAHETYRRIQKGSHDHKLSKINVKKEELELSEAQLKFVRTSVEELSKVLNLTVQERRVLEKRAQGNELTELKIMNSYYRRVKKLVDLHLKGKLFLD